MFYAFLFYQRTNLLRVFLIGSTTNVNYGGLSMVYGSKKRPNELQYKFSPS